MFAQLPQFNLERRFEYGYTYPDGEWQHILVAKRQIIFRAFWKGHFQDQYILGMCSQLAKNFLKNLAFRKIGCRTNFLAGQLFPKQEMVQTTDHFKQSKTGKYEIQSTRKD